MSVPSLLIALNVVLCIEAKSVTGMNLENLEMNTWMNKLIVAFLSLYSEILVINITNILNVWYFQKFPKIG